MKIIENLNWRYATKKFNKNRKVENEKLEALKTAIQLSASSLGLQPYVILEVKDASIRERLYEASWKQASIIEAPHLFVFCNMTSLPDAYLDTCAERRCKARKQDPEQHKGEFIAVVNKLLGDKSAEEIKAFTASETFIAVGTALAACADLRINACPIGGFSPEEYNRILDLEAKGLNAALALPIGYRSENDAYQKAEKLRKSAQELFIEI